MDFKPCNLLKNGKCRLTKVSKVVSQGSKSLKRAQTVVVFGVASGKDLQNSIREVKKKKCSKCCLMGLQTLQSAEKWPIQATKSIRSGKEGAVNY